MLRPGEREHLIEMLRPPGGWRLDFAVGTTFSLDLASALMLPLSFAFCDWQKPDGQLMADPLALLEALRRYGERYAVFCQSGQIRLPSKYQPLVSFLEPCIYDVTSKGGDGVFHPKVWALRFVDSGKSVRYRVLCLSRNLTFDRSWDTGVVLDGELTERERAIAANHPLANLIAALPSLSLRRLSAAHRAGVARIADELRRVQFELPEGFTRYRFWAGGLDGRECAPFELGNRKALIISPFVSKNIVERIAEGSSETHLVSRVESLDALPRETLQQCASVRHLASELKSEAGDEAGGSVLPGEDVLDGLHAKVFIIDQGWDSSFFTGSFNATSPAFESNVEFMVELIGRRSAVGVDQMLRQARGETLFADLLQSYDPWKPGAPGDPALRRLERMVQDAKRELAEGRGRVVVTRAATQERFDLSIQWKRAPELPGNVEVRIWPITLAFDRALELRKDLRFAAVSFEALTPWIACTVTAAEGERRLAASFVLNLPLEGAPEDRHDRIIRSLIGSREQLLRYILFLLAAGDEAALSSPHLQRLIRDEADETATPGSAQVESRMGAVAWGRWPAPRFPSPLIKPCVRVSRTRLSDWLHRKAHGGWSAELMSCDDISAVTAFALR